MDNKEWIAYYAPDTSGRENPSKAGFKSAEEAREYIKENYICKDCLEECKEDNICCMGTACGCEWFILPTDEFDQCEDFGDILEASGAVRIWSN